MKKRRNFDPDENPILPRRARAENFYENELMEAGGEDVPPAIGSIVSAYVSGFLAGVEFRCEGARTWNLWLNKAYAEGYLAGMRESSGYLQAVLVRAREYKHALKVEEMDDNYRR